jgi:hypothetical protein
MAKQHHTGTAQVPRRAAAARTVDPVKAIAIAVKSVVESAASCSAPELEQIERLAYSYWQARGCPEGSPEEDWLRAEAELGKPSGGTTG